MRKIAFLAVLILAACTPTPRPVAPPPVVATVPPPTPPPPVDWRDRPVTPGDWRYQRGTAATVATFGVAGQPPVLAMRCDAASRGVLIARQGVAATMTVRTTSLTRTLPLTADGSGYAVATLAARDPLLDAVGFSRGHFAVEAGTLPMLLVPTWAEIERVIEDCR